MSFKLLQKIDVFDGFINRTIALYEGDLVAIPIKHRADILILSAFPNDYTPTDTSMIGSLHRAGLSVGQLAANKAYDLRGTSAFWISHPIIGPAASLNVGQVACFEPRVLGSPPTVVGDLFRGLFPFLDDRTNKVVAMPVLATGNQGWSPETMFISILEAATHWLAKGMAISELKIVERRPYWASILAARMTEFKSKMEASAQPKPPPAATFDVFLSFSTQDASVADFAKRELSKRSDAKRIFDFRLEIDKGKSWQEEIDRAISSCEAVITILSPNYFSSPECREELMQARLRNKRSERQILFPFYWRDWGKELDLWLQILNYADCREASDKRLACAIRELKLT
jgi:hypothetical protein